MRVANWNAEKVLKGVVAASMDRLEEIGNIIANKAKSLVPVGIDRAQYKTGKDWTARRAGALKASIRVVRLHGDPKRNVRVYAGSRKVFYARFVERGTVKMRARPFLRPALNASKSPAKAILNKGL